MKYVLICLLLCFMAICYKPKASRRDAFSKIPISGDVVQDLKPTLDLSSEDKRMYLDELATLYLLNFGYDKSLNLLDALPPGDVSGGANQVLMGGLTEIKPKEFCEHLIRTRGDTRRDKLELVSSQLGSCLLTHTGTLEKTMAVVLELPFNQAEKDELIESLMFDYARRDPELFQQFLTEKCSDISQIQKDLALKLLVKNFHNKDLDSALKIFRSIQSEQIVLEAARDLGGVYAVRGRSTDYNKAISLIDQNDRLEFVRGYAGTLLETDTNEGLAFLNKMSNKDLRDTLIQQNVERIARHDRKTARDWIEKISDPALKVTVKIYWEQHHL